MLESGFRIGDWAHDVLHSANFALTQEKKTVTLVQITPHELGFASGAFRADIYERAGMRGLAICPPEIGPILRMEYNEQPYLESIQIGMSLQTDSIGHESVFRVVHGGDHIKWLVGDHRHMDDYWSAEDIFVFCC